MTNYQMLNQIGGIKTRLTNLQVQSNVLKQNFFDYIEGLPAHAVLNRIGKAVFVIPPLCSQKHTHKGKTSSLKKISTPRLLFR